MVCFQHLITDLRQRSLYRQTHDLLLNAKNYVNILPVGLDDVKNNIRDLCNNLMKKRNQIQSRINEEKKDYRDIFALCT